MESIKSTLRSLPDKWKLTPVRGKAAYFPKWASIPVGRDLIAHELDFGATGFGLLTGVNSGGIMAIDCDGHLPHALLREILGEDIPPTVSFTSGKDGRAQYLFLIPEVYWANISTKKLTTADGMLEFRWNGCQSVLPPSVHPETGLYQWINAIDTSPVAVLPFTVLDLLTAKPVEQSATVFIRTPRAYSESAIPLERCLSIRHREMLEHGVSMGRRHDAAVGLLRDLLGASSQLTALGEKYDGNPQSLFWDFCDRCSPSLPERERDQIWRSHSGTYAPSINNNQAFQNCIDAWHRQQSRSSIVQMLR